MPSERVHSRVPSGRVLISATSLAPALCEWRAEQAAVLGDDAKRVQLLREAHQLYEQIGAPLQAQRIGQLLSESTS